MDYYCDGACCPDFQGDFKCADGDFWANCFIHENLFCHGDAPVICGDDCCSPTQVCRDGQCFHRSSVSKADHVDALASSHQKMQLTQGKPPLGWYPDISNWDGMLRSAHEGLHNMFLAVWANDRRVDEVNPVGQCFVIGFPAQLGQCDMPWDDGCKGSAATIIQDGEMTLYNTDPITSLVGQDGLDWCNDDPNESQVQTYKFLYKETKTVSFTLSTTTKITTGVTSKTTLEENLVFEKGKEEFDFSFSVEVDTSVSRTQTTTKERDWEQDLTVTVGPRSHVYSQCALSQGRIDSPYDVKVKLHTPIVWACSGPPEDGPNWYWYPQHRETYWQSFHLEEMMENLYGFDHTDLEAIFSAKTGGTFKAVMGQKVVCTTHTVPLEAGESCHPPSSKSNSTSVLV